MSSRDSTSRYRYTGTPHPVPLRDPYPNYNAPRLPSHHFSTRYFSFPVDHDDKGFTQQLRRKSLTGQAAHPLSRQISATSTSSEHETESYDNVDQSIFYAEPNNNKIYRNEKPISIPVQHHHKSGHKGQKIGTFILKPIKSALYPQGHKPDAYISDKNHCGIDNLRLTDDIYSTHTTSSSDKSHPPYSPSKYEDKSPVKHDKKSSPVRKEAKSVLSNVNKKLEQSIASKVSPSEIPTHEEIEDEMMKQDKFLKEKYKLHRFLIIPDGNCLYRAVAQAVLLDQGKHETLRQITLEHITGNKEEFREIIEGDVEEFLADAKLEGVWAGYPEILALSRWLDINVNITTGGSPSNPNVCTTLHYFPPCNDNDVPKKEKSHTERESIWLSWLSSGHYDALTDKVMENPLYDEWLLSRESRIQSDAAMANQMYETDSLNKRQYHENKPGGTYGNQMSPRGTQNAVTGSYENRLMAGSNINDYDVGGSSLPQSYPASSRTSNLNPRPNPPSYKSFYTEHDEEYARALEEEENFDFHYV